VSVSEACYFPWFYCFPRWFPQSVRQLQRSLVNSPALVLLARRINAPECLSFILSVSVARCFGLSGYFLDTRLLSIGERSLLGTSETLVCGPIYHTIYPLYNGCTSPFPWSSTFCIIWISCISTLTECLISIEVFAMR